MTGALAVAIVGSGRMGEKRAAALGGDRLVACCDPVAERAAALAAPHGAVATTDLGEALATRPDVAIVSTTHDALAATAIACVEAGAHVLLEKPAGVTPAEVDAVAAAAAAAGRIVKVGFNHRFHPGIGRLVELARSGEFGPVMYVRGRYGHGGRVGYDREWRASARLGGGGELLDQGMHLLDLCHWILGPLPVRGTLLRTNFWDMEVEDNAALLLGEQGDRRAPWATLHVSWTEWKNEFVLEAYCRTAKIQVQGLGGSYGPETLRVYRMSPEMGPPQIEETVFAGGDGSWAAEWGNLRDAIAAGSPDGLLGDLASARYGLSVVRQAYEGDPASGWAAAGIGKGDDA